MSEQEYDTECATCYHGASMHNRFDEDGDQRCTVPGCECDEFVEPEAGGEG